MGGSFLRLAAGRSPLAQAGRQPEKGASANQSTLRRHAHHAQRSQIKPAEAREARARRAVLRRKTAGQPKRPRADSSATRAKAEPLNRSALASLCEREARGCLCCSTWAAPFSGWRPDEAPLAQEM